jgi:hypothetical protein
MEKVVTIKELSNTDYCVLHDLRTDLISRGAYIQPMQKLILRAIDRAIGLEDKELTKTDIEMLTMVLYVLKV